MNIISGISSAKESESFTRMSRPRDYLYTKKSHYVLTTAVFEWPTAHFSRIDQHFHFDIAIILHFTSCDSCDCDDAFFYSHFHLFLNSTNSLMPLWLLSCCGCCVKRGMLKVGEIVVCVIIIFYIFIFPATRRRLARLRLHFIPSSPDLCCCSTYTRRRHVLCRNQNLVLYKRWKSCYVPSSVLHGACVCCRECRNEIKWRAQQEKSTEEREWENRRLEWIILSELLNEMLEMWVEINLIKLIELSVESTSHFSPPVPHSSSSSSSPVPEITNWVVHIHNSWASFELYTNGWQRRQLSWWRWWWWLENNFFARAIFIESERALSGLSRETYIMRDKGAVSGKMTFK